MNVKQALAVSIGINALLLVIVVEQSNLIDRFRKYERKMTIWSKVTSDIITAQANGDGFNIPSVLEDRLDSYLIFRRNNLD